MLGLSESYFQGSPFNSSDSSFGTEWRKNNHRQSRTFSPGARFVKSPNISPITLIKKMGTLTIAEEPDEATSDKTFTVDNPTHGIGSPHTPVINKTFIVDRESKYKNVGIEKKMEREKTLKRRTMFLIPPTPTKIKGNSKLNASDFEHKFTVDTILKEIGMTKYINLFESEEVSIFFAPNGKNQDTFLTSPQINIPAFLTLDDDDLITIGIMDPEERCEILKAVETYQFLK